MELAKEVNINPEPYIDAKEAAKFLCRSKKSVQQLARDNQLPAYPIRTKAKATWLFRKSELDNWVRSQQNVERHQRS